MRLRRASVIVALSLLTSAATASAECAWVLWIETKAMSRDRAGNWSDASFDRNVHATRDGCEATLVRAIEIEDYSAKNAGIKVFRRGGEDVPDDL